MTRRTVEAVATVTPDGILTAHLPADVPPGEHQVVVLIEDTPAETGQRATGGTPAERPPFQPTAIHGAQAALCDERGPFGIGIYDVGPWPEGLIAARGPVW